jgi:hypothetical protein
MALVEKITYEEGIPESIWNRIKEGTIGIEELERLAPDREYLFDESGWPYDSISHGSLFSRETAKRGDLYDSLVRIVQEGGSVPVDFLAVRYSDTTDLDHNWAVGAWNPSTDEEWARTLHAFNERTYTKLLDMANRVLGRYTANKLQLSLGNMNEVTVTDERIVLPRNETISYGLTRNTKRLLVRLVAEPGDEEDSGLDISDGRYQSNGVIDLTFKGVFGIHSGLVQSFLGTEEDLVFRAAVLQGKTGKIDFKESMELFLHELGHGIFGTGHPEGTGCLMETGFVGDHLPGPRVVVPEGQVKFPQFNDRDAGILRRLAGLEK